MINEDEYKKVVARNLRNIMWQRQKMQALSFPTKKEPAISASSFYLPAAGSNPHKVGVYTYVYVDCVEFRVKSL